MPAFETKIVEPAASPARVKRSAFPHIFGSAVFDLAFHNLHCDETGPWEYIRGRETLAYLPSCSGSRKLPGGGVNAFDTHQGSFKHAGF